jgi:outer membrane protein assembly factor BamB
MGPLRKTDRTAAFAQYWDALAVASPAEELERLRAHVDPTLIAATERISSAHLPQPADPIFVARLERELTREAHAGVAGAQALRPVSLQSRNGKLPADWRRRRELIMPGDRPRRSFAYVAASLLLIVAVISVSVVLREVRPGGHTGRSVPGAQAAGWPTDRGNSARTGDMPGPGPKGIPIERWRYRVDGAFVGPMAIAGGILYAGNSDGYLYAIETSTGHELWRFPSITVRASQPTVSDGLVFIGASGDLLALDAITGAERWRFVLGGSADLGVVATDGSLFLSGPNGTLYALDSETGTKRWEIATGISWSRLPAYDEGTLYLGDTAGRLHAYDAENGRELWAFQTDPGSDTLLTPAVEGGVLYAGSNGGWFYALDAANGQELWRFETPGHEQLSSPAIGGETVYVVSDDGSVYALDAATGNLRWTVVTGDQIRAAPALVGDALYVAGYDRNLYQLDASTGAEQWRFPLDFGTDYGPVVADGTVYVGTKAGSLYAIGGSGIDSTPTQAP